MNQDEVIEHQSRLGMHIRHVATVVEGVFIRIPLFLHGEVIITGHAVQRFQAHVHQPGVNLMISWSLKVEVTPQVVPVLVRISRTHQVTLHVCVSSTEWITDVEDVLIYKHNMSGERR